MKKLITESIMAGIMALSAVVPAFASSSDLLGKNWRVYNVKPATSSYWDINKLATDGTFPIQQFETTTSGSFAVYVLNNYNVDITDKTITADLSWTAGSYKTRSDACSSGAFVRLEFQDVTAGPYDVNDYWWSTVNLNLNTSTTGILTAALSDRNLWTNMAGMSATDETTTGYVDWNGNIMKDTPYDGFTKAMKNVKQIGLSFGNACSYASGVALDGGIGTFTMSSFTITP